MQSTIKAVIILLVVGIVALIIGLIYVWDKKSEEVAKATSSLADKENEITALNTQLKAKKDELKVKEDTETQLKAQIEQSNQEKTAAQQQLAKVTNDLFVASAKLQKAEDSVKSLSSEKTTLQGTVKNLNAQVASLDDRIKKLEDELDRGEKNRALLLKELASVRLEKANLEKKWTDIGEVRGQYKVLRHDEILESRRRWIAQGYDGFYTKTGNFETPKPYTSPAGKYDLKAEIYRRVDTNKVPYSVSDKPASSRME
jgi:chromosome segregation ATPase